VSSGLGGGCGDVREHEPIAHALDDHLIVAGAFDERPHRAGRRFAGAGVDYGQRRTCRSGLVLFFLLIAGAGERNNGDEGNPEGGVAESGHGSVDARVLS